MKVLLDTDIGSNIDDALALAYLLQRPDCDLLGITTVTGQSRQRARLASALCRAAGRAVPICPGRQVPLFVGQRQARCAPAAALDRWPHDDAFEYDDPVAFCAHIIQAHAGEVTLLSLGPLTNAAALYSMEPSMPPLLRAHVLMGGVFRTDGDPRPSTQGQPEHNIALDPHAAGMVLRADLRRVRCVGLDVTTRCSLPVGVFRASCPDNPILRAAVDLGEPYLSAHDTVYFSDPLAAMSLFDDTLCGFERGLVRVELEDETRLGMTSLTPEREGPHEAAVAVDARRVIRDFWRAFQT